MLIPCAIGYGQIIVIVLVVILLFGGKKIPELMRGLGRGVKEFKDAVNKDYTAEDNKPGDTPERPSNHTCSAAANK